MSLPYPRYDSANLNNNSTSVTAHIQTRSKKASKHSVPLLWMSRGGHSAPSREASFSRANNGPTMSCFPTVLQQSRQPQSIMMVVQDWNGALTLLGTKPRKCNDRHLPIRRTADANASDTTKVVEKSACPLVSTLRAVDSFGPCGQDLHTRNWVLITRYSYRVRYSR